MCGIAGLIARRGAGADAARLAAMCDAVAHRGPDDSGIWIQGNLGLGHRRLSIVDISRNGAQPMLDDSSGRRIIFNGAIYNHVELRTALIKDGYRFRSGTDTEVILAAYDAWGTGCVSRFNGMWSFAIHDPAANLLFCSRDRFGVRPFYFIDTPTCFAFGSEIRQLLPLLDSRRARQSVLLDFVFTGFCGHREGTFFEGVETLAAGHNLLYDLSADSFRQERWYRLEPLAGLDDLSPETASALLREKLDDAVRLRLRSDVPVGTCLSGGLDSSSIACIAAPEYQRNGDRRFCAVTAVSEDPANDESAFARLVAKHGHMEWLPVKPVISDFESALDDIVDTQEEPFASPSICMQYFVMRAAAAAGLKVMLDGQGGDEVLLGYERYYGSHMLLTLRSMGWRATAHELICSIRNNERMNALNLAWYTAYFSAPGLRYRTLLHRHRYLGAIPPLPSHLVDYQQASRDVFELQRLEIERTNLPPLLRYEDRNAMRHGIETRLPFLDYQLVEFALSLPEPCKIRDGWTKYVLRLAMSGMLPADIVWRKDKRGFEAPSSIWLRGHAGAMESAVKDSRLLGSICSMTRLSAAYPALDADTRWRLYSIALWEKRFGLDP